jgi:hypothetical protein
MTPGMRFAAGCGHAVLSAALAYVREHRAGLIEAIAARDETPIALAGE